MPDQRPLPTWLELQLEKILDGPDHERDAGITALRREHPEHADAIRDWQSVVRTEAGRVDGSAAEETPAVFAGRYRVLETLGEGGMGRVYLAEQTEPVRRRVAVKVIKRGMDTREVLARFEAERQALAIMSHPHIARVLDAGATPLGQPFFVMELVRGTPMTEYCDVNRLPIRDRLRLFQQVCRAVQHAHQKGIIHRDLKPSNILVESQEGQPAAKIIDFGLARATDHRLTDKSIHTEHGRILGTLEYMSPEQAEMSGADVDTRTDVYALGVLLYELLVGVVPFGPAKLRRVATSELQRLIREEVPVRPSARVAREAEVEVAERRAAAPEVLARALRGDLDWITMKALEKDRTRRYQSAAELAADVERHLRNEAVAAGPPSSAYRFRKFVRRHRGKVVVSATLVLLVLTGSVWILALYLRVADSDERARHALAESQWLIDLGRVHSLQRRADTDLWPEVAARVPEMERWLADAEDLVARLPRHRQRLVEQRQRGVRIEVDAREVWRFGSTDEHLLHDNLVELVDGVAALTADGGLVAQVRERRRWALEVAERTFSGDDAKRLWQQAAADLQRSGRYSGLELRPQLGLLPLGLDPESGLLECAHVRSGPPAGRSKRGLLKYEETSGIVFVLLPEGQYWMGAQPDDAGGRNHDPLATNAEGPPHLQDVPPFFVAKHELTQAQWLALAGGDNPSATRRGPGMPATLRHPVESVSWTAATMVLSHHGLLLPTEVQWEYSCRGGTGTPWWTGRDKESLLREGPVANIADRSTQEQGVNWPALGEWPEYRDGAPFTCPVDDLLPNPFGLFHVHGNVDEWCANVIQAYPGGQTIEVRQRAVRGGSYSRGYTSCRASKRSGRAESDRTDNIGVRAVRKLD